MTEPISLRRDCEAIQIPYGDKFILPAGTQVYITQSLGGTYTAHTDHGHLVRIEGKDADALGLDAPAPAPQASVSPTFEPPNIEKTVWEQLKTVYDPEIPANIVDLGLVYLCRATPLPDGGNHVDVQMTLTAPGCGMGDVLKADAESKILGIPGVTSATVEMVVDPPWNPGLMSEAAKLQLGML